MRHFQSRRPARFTTQSLGFRRDLQKRTFNECLIHRRERSIRRNGPDQQAESKRGGYTNRTKSRQRAAAIEGDRRTIVHEFDSLPTTLLAEIQIAKGCRLGSGNCAVDRVALDRIRKPLALQCRALPHMSKVVPTLDRMNPREDSRVRQKSESGSPLLSDTSSLPFVQKRI